MANGCRGSTKRRITRVIVIRVYNRSQNVESKEKGTEVKPIYKRVNSAVLFFFNRLMCAVSVQPAEEFRNAKTKILM